MSADSVFPWGRGGGAWPSNAMLPTTRVPPYATRKQNIPSLYTQTESNELNIF